MKKYFDRPPSTMGDWLVLAAGTALLFAAVARLPAALMALGGLLALLAPFGWGLVLAYVLDIPTRFFAQKLFGGRRGWATKWAAMSSRAMSTEWARWCR